MTLLKKLATERNLFRLIKVFMMINISYISYISATKATRGVTNVCGCDAKDCINPAGLLDD